MGVWLQFGRGAAVWEGRGVMGKKKKEKQRKRVSIDWGYIMVFLMESPTAVTRR
jgi:hypothetical protein